MFNKLREIIDGLKPEAKGRLWQSIFIGGLVTVAILFVFARHDQLKPPTGKEQKEPAKKSVSINSRILDTTLPAELDETKKRLAELEKANAERTGAVMPPRSSSQVPRNLVTGMIDKVIAAKQNQNPAPQQPAAPVVHETKSPPPHETPIPRRPSGAGGKTKFSAPDPPGESGGIYQDAKAIKWTYAGKIENSENAEAKKTTADPAKADGSGDKKKDKKTVHLPVGFMPARTLNGLLVPATNDGKGDPYPLMVRVSAKAILPNENTAQLSGCIFATEAIGSLQQSRALARLTSLTCLDKKNQAVIEADIRGFIQDADGVPGLSGIVAAPKFGDMVRLSALAGALSGIGDGMSLTSATQTISAIGPLSTYGTTAQDIGIAAAGKAISGATKKINEVYSDLLHQSLPVIEVGNGKKVTIWVTKGVDLEIKNYKNFNWY